MMTPRQRLVIAGMMLAHGAAAQAVSQTASGLLFQAEGKHLTGTCTGQPVVLEGNHNTVLLTGPCASLLVKGVANDIHLILRPGGGVRVEGSGNHVAASGVNLLPPVLLGNDNTVMAAPSPLPSPAAPPVEAPKTAPVKPTTGPLLLDGADQQRLAECGGRDVTIAGQRSAYILHGACRSLAVHGDLLTVRADLAPGAHVLIDGRGDVVSYGGHGNPPDAKVRGDGSEIQRADDPPG